MRVEHGGDRRQRKPLKAQKENNGRANCRSLFDCNSAVHSSAGKRLMPYCIRCQRAAGRIEEFCDRPDRRQENKREEQ